MPLTPQTLASESIDYSKSSDNDYIAQQIIEKIINPLNRIPDHEIRTASLYIAVERNHDWSKVDHFYAIFKHCSGRRCEPLETMHKTGMRLGFETTNTLKENGVSILRSFMKDDRYRFDVNFFGNFALLFDQLGRVRKIEDGWDHKVGIKYTISGKTGSKKSLDDQDDQAMADIFAAYWFSDWYKTVSGIRAAEMHSYM